MNKSNPLLVLALLAATAKAHAATHMFWCNVFSGTTQQQAYYEVDEASPGSGQLTLSNWNEADGWKPFLTVAAQAEIKWSATDESPVVTGVSLDLGRTGQLEFHTTTPYNRYHVANGLVTANLMGFNYPHGVPSAYCTYFLGTPKPGMSGSN